MFRSRSKWYNKLLGFIFGIYFSKPLATSCQESDWTVTIKRLHPFNPDKRDYST